MSDNQIKIQDVAFKLSKRLDKQLGTPSCKALLANLRNSIGRPLSETITIWPLLFDVLPDEYLGKSQALTKEEDALLTMLQLYALYHQGQDKPLSSYERKNLGFSLASLRGSTDTVSVDRRFNALITATTYEEFKHHLRQLVRLLKSRTKGNTPIDFAKLCQDLYWFSRGYEENVRLSWAKAYYSQFRNKGEETHEQ
ncbi:type I-E CRISPR-associated protein Cse2/CasB [Hutsoniella sourekii]